MRNTAGGPIVVLDSGKSLHHNIQRVTSCPCIFGGGCAGSSSFNWLKSRTEISLDEAVVYKLGHLSPKPCFDLLPSAPNRWITLHLGKASMCLVRTVIAVGKHHGQRVKQICYKSSPLIFRQR